MGPGNPVNLTGLPESHETAPVWSPVVGGARGVPAVRQDTLLAFESDRFGSRDIFVLDPFRPQSGGAAPNPVRVTTSSADDANPEWSPDGRYLIFESDRAGPKDLWRITVPDGGPVPEHEITQLTEDVQASFDPAWTVYEEDQSVIAFSGPERDGGDCELNAIQELDGTSPGLDSEMTTVDSPAFKDDAPSFSPLGLPLTFASVRNGNEDLYAYADGQSTRLTDDPAADRHPGEQAIFHLAALNRFRPIGRRSNRKKRRPRASQLSADARPCSEPPSAAFTFSPARPAAGERVRLDATSSSDVDGRVTRYEWDLDADGRFELRNAAAVVERTFERNGLHDVVLRVVDDTGAVERTRRQVPVGRDGPPVACTKLGSAGDDVLRGTPGKDVLCGLGGNDVLYGEAGADVLDGGTGNDRLFGGSGADRLLGRSGDDRVRGGGGKDVLSGHRGRDALAGERERDKLVGGASRDRLTGGRANDRLSGGGGADTLSGGRGRDRLVGGPGPDKLRGGPRADRFLGGRGRDRVFARDGIAERLFGGRGRDRARADRADRITGIEVVLR